MKNKNLPFLLIYPLSIIFLIVLSACAAEPGTGKTGVQWLPLVIAFVLLAGAGYAVYYLISSGKWKLWQEAGINHSKWNMQESKLRGDLKDLEADKAKLVDELGRQAWQARVPHPEYVEPYSQLEVLDQKVKVLEDDAKALQTNLEQVSDSRIKVNEDYDNQLKRLDTVLKDARSNLDKSRSKQADREKQLLKLNNERTKLDTEIQEKAQKLTEIQASDVPDKQKKVESISSSIHGLEKSMMAAVEKIPVLQTDIEGLKSEQQPLTDELTRLEEQLERVKIDQKTALDPLDRQISELDTQLKSKLANLDDLRSQMETHLKSLGPIVDAVRPESGELAGAYYKIDMVNTDMTASTRAHELVSKQLEACDKGAVRNFWITLGTALLLVILLIILLAAAF